MKSAGLKVRYIEVFRGEFMHGNWGDYSYSCAVLLPEQLEVVKCVIYVGNPK